MPRAIINADDFGASSVVNRAIEDCLRKGLCSHASLMANMPGFEEACELSLRHGWADRIGLHLVLRDGPPLSHKIQRFPASAVPTGSYVSRGRCPTSRGWCCPLPRETRWPKRFELRLEVPGPRDHPLPPGLTLSSAYGMGDRFGPHSHCEGRTDSARASFQELRPGAASRQTALQGFLQQKDSRGGTGRHTVFRLPGRLPSILSPVRARLRS